MEELQRRTVGLEAECSLRKTHLLPADFAVEAGVADAAVEPVVHAVVEVVRLRMRVADAPARHDLLANVGLAVPIGVLEEKQAGRLRNDHAAIREDQARRDVQLVGEHRELVRLAVAVGVLADLDGVIAESRRLDVVRVVTRLADPEAAALVPREGDGLADVRLGREQLQAHVGRDLRAFLAALHAERLLEGERLGTPFVVGDIGIGLALLGLSLGDKLFPIGLARSGQGREHVLANLFGR